MFKAVLVATADVVKRQYLRYFEMEVTEETKQKLDSARTHNIDSEDVMGMFSANQSRAPHATLLFISSKIKAKKNNTLAYLSSHPESETVVRKAVTVGAKLRRCTQGLWQNCRVSSPLRPQTKCRRRRKEKGKRWKRKCQGDHELFGSGFWSSFPVTRQPIDRTSFGYP